MKHNLTTSRATYNGKEIKVRYHGQVIDKATDIKTGEFVSIYTNDWQDVIEEAEDRR